MNKTLQARRWP